MILASCVGKKLNFGVLRRKVLQIAGICLCLRTLAQLSHSNYTCCHGNAPKSIEIPLFLQFWVYFSPFNIIFNYRPTLRTISYYEIIMKYHQEILYAKYHFVRRVGWYLKIKKCVQKWSKIDQKVQIVLYLWFFWALPWQRL